jgi:hypothetical protein
MSRMGLYIINEKGNTVPCDGISEWGTWFGTHRLQYQLSDEIADLSVSTVFLGIDHNLTMAGPPLLWETMVFDKGSPFMTHPMMDVGCWRFATQKEAYEFHDNKVEELAEALKKSKSPFRFGENQNHD